MFVGLHVLLAERTETPELAISEQEGKDFMQAVQNVMRHYSVETTQKTLDWVALMGAASGMYVPRLAAISIRRKSVKRSAQRPQAAPANPQGASVVQIVPDMASGAGFQEGA